MINSDPDTPEIDDEAVERILRSGAGGAVALAGIATAIVVAIWFLFYLLVFIPRATVP